MKPAGWYRARLRAMPKAEIGHRLLQLVRRERRRWAARATARETVPPAWNAAIGAGRTIRFFDLELPAAGAIDWSRDYRSGVSAPLLFYADLDYRDVAQVGDSKYTWELSRHQFLVPWALEYPRSGEEDIAAAVTGVILHWIAANPRYLGINWTSSLEMALRILSWGIVLDLCGRSAHATRARAVILRSVAEQAAFIRGTLSLFSSANNHLVGELVGLLATAAYFPEVREAEAYGALARKRILQEALKQVLADGVNREQAIYYHHYTLEYLLTALGLLERLQWPPPAELIATARRMIRFVDAMTDDRGTAFAVGDADDGTVTGLNGGTDVGVYESLLWSGWWLFGDQSAGAHAARIAATRGGGNVPDPRNLYWYGPRTTGPLPDPGLPSPARWLFPDGGYFVSKDEGFTLLFKAGPFGYPSIAAHAHCDQLSVGLRGGPAVVLGDSGTYVYHTEDPWRRYFRGTAAHNTVRVDGRDQAEYAGPFLWSTHADARLGVESQSVSAYEVRGTHDGYARLADPVRHERSVEYRAGLGYRVVDRLQGREAHRYELFWNFGPGVRLEASPSLRDRGLAWEWCLIGDGLPRLRFAVTTETPGEARVHEGDESLPAGFESRRYLEKRPVAQLCVSTLAERCTFRSFVFTSAAGAESWAEPVDPDPAGGSATRRS
jgi:heparinase II/III-like protein